MARVAGGCRRPARSAPDSRLASQPGNRCALELRLLACSRSAARRLCGVERGAPQSSPAPRIDPRQTPRRFVLPDRADLLRRILVPSARLAGAGALPQGAGTIV